MGWRAFVLDEESAESRILMFCPRCAEREFGAFGWEGRD
jgi:hypothetical protein